MRVESSGVTGASEGWSVESMAPASTGAAGTTELARDHVDTGPVEASAVWSSPSSPAALTTTTLRALGHAIAEDGLGGFDDYLAAHPEAMRELANASREETETMLRAAISHELGGGAMAGVEAYWQADAALDRFEGALEADLRETVRSTATLAIEEQLTAIDAHTPEEIVGATRSAPPGSPVADLAARLGVRGDAGDLDRVRAHQREARDALLELRTTLAGHTWSPEELPGTSRRVMDAMGLAGSDSMGAAALHRSEVDAATAAHRAEIAADVGYTGIEVVHGMHLTHVAAAGEAGITAATTIALPIALCAAGIAFGLAVHHQIEVNREERTEVARSLGL